MLTQEPEFEIQASPLGLSGLAGELPGLIGTLRGALLKAMCKKVVEPNRKFLDVIKIYKSKFVAKAGGQGGLVTVTVIGARDVVGGSQPRGPPKAHHQGTSSLGGATNGGRVSDRGQSSGGAREKTSLSGSVVDPFVEMRFGREVHRTPFVHNNASSPIWNWSFNVKLAADIPGSSTSPEAAGQGGPRLVLRDDTLRFCVMNAMTIGEPEKLCAGKVGA